MESLGVTIGGQAFDHLVYHFVLTYSNWESITICFSESFESLSEGLQNAVWELGGVPPIKLALSMSYFFGRLLSNVIQDDDGNC